MRQCFILEFVVFCMISVFHKIFNKILLFIIYTKKRFLWSSSFLNEWKFSLCFVPLSILSFTLNPHSNNHSFYRFTYKWMKCHFIWMKGSLGWTSNMTSLILYLNKFCIQFFFIFVKEMFFICCKKIGSCNPWIYQIQHSFSLLVIY